MLVKRKRHFMNLIKTIFHQLYFNTGLLKDLMKQKILIILIMLISRINFQFGENIERNGYVTNLILNQIKLLSQEAQDMMIILPLEEKEIHKIKKLYF